MEKLPDYIRSPRILSEFFTGPRKLFEWSTGPNLIRTYYLSKSYVMTQSTLPLIYYAVLDFSIVDADMNTYYSIEQKLPNYIHKIKSKL